MTESDRPVDGPLTLVLTRRQRTEMIDHSRVCAPNEACGMLVGRGATVESVHCLTNADASSITYRIDSREQFVTMRDAEESGRDVIGCFHSHTHSEAFPSQTDIGQAFYPEWIYALVSLHHEDPVLRAFRIVDGAVFEIPVETSAE